MKMNKKAQLTVFIIIGIVLLFSTALILFIKNTLVEYKAPAEVAVEQLPTQLQPLYTYVSECIAAVTKEAIIKAGSQGGYVDTSNFVLNPLNPTEADGVGFFADTNQIVPYWYYMKSPNKCTENCIITTKQPFLRRNEGSPSIEAQIDEYVKQKLSSCLMDFLSFKQQGFEIAEGQINALTTITRTDVFVQVTYPLKITYQGAQSELSKFVSRVPINLGKVYDLASDITKKEMDSSYLFFVAINLISSYSGVDAEKLPPVQEYTFMKGAEQVWRHTAVRNILETLLIQHIPGLSATGTLNFNPKFYPGEDEFARGLYSLFVLPMNKTYSASVEFDYLGWPIYLSVNPNSGEIIKPAGLQGLGVLLPVMSFLQITQYKFTYDMSFPVIVTITDPAAFDGEGYTFQFALEENMRNNQPLKSDTNLLSFSARKMPTLVCGENNYKSGDIAIDVSDSITKSPIEGALIYFTFGRDSCFVGETRTVEGKAEVKSPMPVGFGTLTISKDGYLTKTISLGTNLGETKKISAELDRYVDVAVSVERVPFAKGIDESKCDNFEEFQDNIDMFCQKNPGQGVCLAGGFKDSSVEEMCNTWLPRAPALKNLEPTEQAIVTLRRIKDNPAEEDYVVSLTFEGTGAETQTTSLVPGNYEINGNIFDHQLTVVPSDKSCYVEKDEWWEWITGGEEKCTTIDEVVFDAFPKGGIAIPNFAVDAASLQNSNKLIIYLISIPYGYTRDSSGTTNLKHKDLEQLGKVEQYSSDYADKLTPVFTGT